MIYRIIIVFFFLHLGLACVSVKVCLLCYVIEGLTAAVFVMHLFLSKTGIQQLNLLKIEPCLWYIKTPENSCLFSYIGKLYI